MARAATARVRVSEASLREESWKVGHGMTDLGFLVDGGNAQPIQTGQVPWYLSRVGLFSWGTSHDANSPNFRYGGEGIQRFPRQPHGRQLLSRPGAEQRREPLRYGKLSLVQKRGMLEAAGSCVEEGR